MKIRHQSTEINSSGSDNNDTVIDSGPHVCASFSMFASFTLRRVRFRLRENVINGVKSIRKKKRNKQKMKRGDKKVLLDMSQRR